MAQIESCDVVIAGGGIAGLSAAAALHGLGYRIVLVEPGLATERRLAGEMIHPMGVMALQQIGLWSALGRLNPMRIRGFAVSAGELNPMVSALPKATHILSYNEAISLQEEGFALDHGTLRETLLKAVMNLPTVTVLATSRIQGLDFSDLECVLVRVGDSQQTRTIRCSLVVAADGPSSATRHMAGIKADRKRVSNMVGYVVKNVELPLLKYAYLFLGGSGPVFAYPIDENSVRLLFDGPLGASSPQLINHCYEHLALLPLPFRLAAKDTIDKQPPQIAVSQFVTVSAVAHDRIVLVGDAGGCCHPVTATGLTNSARDAVRLRDALLKTPNNIPAAVRDYRKHNERTQRTRSILARDVYDVSCARGPELSLVQASMFKYWQRSRTGRATSMELLSTRDERMSVLAREWSRIVLFGATIHAYESLRERQFSFSRQSQIVVGLSRLLLRHARAAVSVKPFLRRQRSEREYAVVGE